MIWPPLPSWIKDPPPIEDEIVKEPWGYHALQMANRFYRPKQLAYRRTQIGEDHRVKYMVYFLDVRGQRVLELGPHEGHHSIILEKMGVGELVCIECRADNVAKCRRIKEKYHLDNVAIIQQDIEKLYNGQEAPQFSGKFDLVFCTGVLYHFPNPARALQWCREQAPTLFLGTHYVEPESPQSYPGFPPATLEYRGRRYDGMAFREGGLASPLSGVSEWSFWATEPALLRMIADAGYREASVLGKDVQNGYPHITILAAQ